MAKKLYRIKRCKNILKYVHKQMKRRKNRLDGRVRDDIEHHTLQLEEALARHNREEASTHAATLELLCESHLKKNLFEYLFDHSFSLAIALGIAVLVRQSWFELYEIPTGSMRPTLREKDRLIVSKNQFGINIPLTTKHLLFDEKKVERGNIIVFTSHNMDMPDADMRYFFLFPGKKQLIKRMIGKPGDTLYFYGGNIYGIDREGNDISHELQRYDDIDYTPYIHLDGKAMTGRSARGLYSPVVFYQMNKPIAKMDVSGSGRLRGEVIQDGTEAKNYSDFWGFKNYGMTQILSKEEVRSNPDLTLYDVPESDYYLAIKHHPDIRTGFVGQDRYGRERPMLGVSHSLLPLKEEHMKRLFNNLYTARFTADNGNLFQWHYSLFGTKKQKPYAFTPKMENLPNGNYEFYHGTAYKVLPEGILSKVGDDHVLANYSPELLRLFYNGGIEFDEHFIPSTERDSLEPQRFAYFRDGTLYSMGAPIMEKDDPLLQDFVSREKAREENSTPFRPYEAFVDQGKPSVEMIKKYGIKVPEKNYLVLGDNFAMSADSRDFGFVPEDNLRGVPKALFWPPGKRFGLPKQKGNDIVTAPRVVVWILGSAATCGWIVYQRRRKKRRLESLTPSPQKS